MLVGRLVLGPFVLVGLSIGFLLLRVRLWGVLRARPALRVRALRK